MELLHAEETCATLYPLSHPLPTIKVAQELDQDRNRQINPPTFKELGLPHNKCSETPAPSATPLPALPEEQVQGMPPGPVDPTVGISGQFRHFGRTSTY